MDVLLSKVTQQAVQYAIRSGITITTGFAVNECARLLKRAPPGREREEIQHLQMRLESKMGVISPSIDMMELIAARGNTSLQSAVSLTKEIRFEMQKLGSRVQAAAHQDASALKAKSREETDAELRRIISQMKLLLARIEDAIPLISLAITTSGVNLSTKLSGTISPSRLLQASTLLSAADATYASQPTQRQQVGPTYVVSLYMLFAAHVSRQQGENVPRQTTWKKVMQKARVKLWRVPLDQLYNLPGECCELNEAAASNFIPADVQSGEFAYQLVIAEDLQHDGLYHEPDQSTPFDDMPKVGIRDVVPVHELSKIFYADTGKILNIGDDGDTYSPTLLLKRDVHAEPQRRMLQRTDSHVSLRQDTTNEVEHEHDAQAELSAQFERESMPVDSHKESPPLQTETDDALRLPADIDPEWLALEVYSEGSSDTEDEDDDDDETSTSRPTSSRSVSLEVGLTSAIQQLNLRATPSANPKGVESLASTQPMPLLQLSSDKRGGLPIKTSLSLLEMLMKLTALQQFRQESHLAIEDEVLNFFLEDSSTAGAGADKQYRQQLRQEAQRRVGFDPYDESPIKRRNEEYIRHANDGRSLSASYDNGLAYDESYEYNEQTTPRLNFDFRPSIEPRGSTPSTPSPPRQLPYYQTPSRSSTPGLGSETHLHMNHYQSSPGSGRSQLSNATFTSHMPETRPTTLRSQNEAKPRSPLLEVTKIDEGE